MSSWLSLFNYEDGDDHHIRASSENPNSSASSSTASESSGGVSAFSQTLSHRLRGVAAFLVPPAASISNQEVGNQTTSSSSPTIRGIKQDLVEIEETVKSRLSLLSSFTSNLLRYNNRHDCNSEEEEDNGTDDKADDDSEGEDENYVAGTNQEIVGFVRELSSRVEFWADFPIRLPNDFDMSDSQREHCAAIEHLVPSLESLRKKVCNYMRDGHFWMIYFTILLPRFNESDLKYLSTPEIVEVREALMSKLLSDRSSVAYSSLKSEADISVEGIQDGKEGEELLHEQVIPADTLGSPQEDKSANNEKPDQWLECEDGKPSLRAQTLSNEEELSFSDLEDDDGLSDGHARFRSLELVAASALGERIEWIQLDEGAARHVSDLTKAGQSMIPGKDSEGEDSNDWDHVDDADIESLMSA